MCDSGFFMASSLLAPAPFTALLPATGGGRGGWAPPRRITNVTGPTPPPNLLYVDGEFSILTSIVARYHHRGC
jgi:hypothetical protein